MSDKKIKIKIFLPKCERNSKSSAKLNNIIDDTAERDKERKLNQPVSRLIETGENSQRRLDNTSLAAPDLTDKTFPSEVRGRRRAFSLPRQTVDEKRAEKKYLKKACDECAGLFTAEALDHIAKARRAIGEPSQLTILRDTMSTHNRPPQPRHSSGRESVFSASLLRKFECLEPKLSAEGVARKLWPHYTDEPSREYDAGTQQFPTRARNIALSEIRNRIHARSPHLKNVSIPENISFFKV